MKTSITPLSLGLCALALLSVAPMPANALIMTYFGEDLNSSASTPLGALTNSSAAAANFLAGLTGVGTETFESLSGSTPLNLNFAGAGTATLSGGSGSVVSLANSSVTNGAGRYGITRDGGTERYYEVQAGGSGNFTISFSSAIAAFGFYGIDIGDFGGTLQLQLSGGSTALLNVPNTVGSNGSTDGSVLFYGFISNSAAETVTSISFLTSTGQGDIFALDNMTVGSLEQVVAGVPEGGSSLAMMGLALAGIAGFRRTRLADPKGAL